MCVSLLPPAGRVRLRLRVQPPAPRLHDVTHLRQQWRLLHLLLLQSTLPPTTPITSNSRAGFRGSLGWAITEPFPPMEAYLRAGNLFSLTLSVFNCQSMAHKQFNPDAHTPHFVFLTQRNYEDSAHQFASLFNSGTGKNQMGVPYVG